MRELVIVVSDLYVSQESPERRLPDGIALPGLQHVARFGTRSVLSDGWRPWLAHWLTADAQARLAPAAVAASATVRSDEPAAAAVWIATPLHLVAGLTSLHFDRRSLLRLNPDDSKNLAEAFQRDFHDSGFRLQPLETGDFLLFGPGRPVADRPEPARWMGNSVAEAHQLGGTDDNALRRLGSEVEMWLHGHDVNVARSRRGDLTVTGLWFWGGGTAPPGPVADRDFSGPAGFIAERGLPAPTIAFGRDAYVHGLWASIGARVLPVPRQLKDVFGYPPAQRTVLVLELGPMLHSNPAWTFFDALARVDRDFIMPAIDALSTGALESLVVLGNDQAHTLRARDRFKIWRRPRPGLSGLQ